MLSFPETDQTVAFAAIWAPGPNGPVNKRNLSTGENGEFGVESYLAGTLQGSTKLHASH
jgi:hypothetical protein